MPNLDKRTIAIMKISCIILYVKAYILCDVLRDQIPAKSFSIERGRLSEIKV